MNNENDIIKEFNDTFNKTEQPVDAYRAVQNQNVINQPMMQQNIQNFNQNVVMPGYSQVQSNSVFSEQVVNTQQNVVQGNNDMSSVNNLNVINNNIYSNQNVDTTNMQENVQQLYNTSNYINNEQNVVKKKKMTFKVNSELKEMLILVLVLVIAMSFIPTIFDLFNDLKLKIFR